MKKLLIKSAKIPGRSINKEFDVLIVDGVIGCVDLADKSSAMEAGNDLEIIDAGGRRLVPGYIDLHVQGAGGGDILDGTKEAVERISKVCAMYGVTSFLGTTVYRANDKNDHLSVASKLTGKKMLPGARMDGIHIEGPFISIKKRGMIQVGSITPPSLKILEDIFNKTNSSLRMMTIAPELPGADDIIKMLLGKSVIASLGHTEATYEQAKRAFDLGISHVTHIYNAMMGIHHRAPGPLIAIYENKSIISQIITDGVHIQPPVLRFTSDILGTDRLAVITDGMRPMGLHEGEYVYEGKKYNLKNGTAVYTDGTLIGTAIGTSELLNRYKKFTGRSFNEVLKMATEVPAKVLGLDNYSIELKKGMRADLLLLDEGFMPKVTIVNGEVVYRA